MIFIQPLVLVSSSFSMKVEESMMRDDDKRRKGKIIEIIKCRDDVTPSSHHVGSSRRYSEALFFSEIIKRTGLTKTTQREEHR